MKLRATHTLKGALKKRRYSSPLFNNAELSFKPDRIELKYKDKVRQFSYDDLKLVVLDYTKGTSWNIQLYLLFADQALYFLPSGWNKKERIGQLSGLINDLGANRFYYLPQHELAGFFPAGKKLPKTRSYKELTEEEKWLHRKYIGPYMDPIWVWLMVLVPLSACLGVGVSKLL